MAEKRTEKTAAKAQPRTKRTKSRSKPKTGTPTHEQIAERAYLIFEETGASDPLHNWLRAEDELTTGRIA